MYPFGATALALASGRSYHCCSSSSSSFSTWTIIVTTALTVTSLGIFFPCHAHDSTSRHPRENAERSFEEKVSIEGSRSCSRHVARSRPPTPRFGAARASLPFACRGSRSAEQPVRRESRGGVSPPGGQRGAEEERGGRVSPCLRRIQGIGRQVSSRPRTPSFVGAAIGRVRGVPSADRVGAPTTQQGCPKTSRERYQSTPDP